MESLVAVDHTAEPGTSVEAYGYVSDILLVDFESPLLEHICRPVNGMSVCVRADGTAAEAVGYNIEMIHGLIVLGGKADDFLNYRVVSLRDRCAGRYGQHGQNCYRGSCEEH